MPEKQFDTEVAAFWNRESADWGEKYGRRSSYFYRCRTFLEFSRQTGLQSAAILDYGCGSGDITFPMLRDGHAVTGVDIAADMARRAQARANDSGFSATASYRFLDDEARADIITRKFDIVVCSSVIEYVDDDVALVKMFHSVLNDGGFLILSIPDRRSLFCRLDRWMYANRTLMPRFVPVEKLRYLDIQKRQYDVQAFVDSATTMGFRLLARKYNTVKLQRGAVMEKFSNLPGVGMLALLMFRKGPGL